MVWPFWYGADGTNPWDINRHGGPFFWHSGKQRALGQGINYVDRVWKPELDYGPVGRVYD